MSNMLGIQYRPKTLNEVHGNKKIVQEFKNRSLTYNFPSYMMFLGHSGTGKSTLAFIIAKTLNCLNPIVKDDCIEPCNECKVCTDIMKGQFKRDTSYVDATNLGKEGVKKLSDMLSYAPRFDKNKVVIIDEAHLLNSAQAKGAMLLLSEKPRENVYIILCTTEADKFHIALKTRYEIYNFYTANYKDIFEYLKEVFLQLNKTTYADKEFPEHFKEEAPKILLLIADNAFGSYRNALQMLDRVMESELYTVQEVEEEFNIINLAQQFEFIYNLLYGRNIKETFNLIEKKDNEYLYNLMYKYLVKAQIWKKIKSKKEIDDIIEKYQNTNRNKGEYHLALLSRIFGEPVDKLLDLLKDVEVNQKGFTFNKRYFKLSLIQYIKYVERLNRDAETIPKLTKRQKLEEKPKVRERVKK
jgi:DNA polymerase-3 subunit gamma/tau